jgi:hypothetical protein
VVPPKKSPRHRDEPVHVEALQPSSSGDAPEGASERRLQGGPHQQIVLDRHEVQGRAHERRPHDLPPLDQVGEIVATEVAKPGPQPDIGRSRHLSLETSQTFDAVGDD